MEPDIATHFYPEIRAGGYSRVDGTIEFYQRINALIDNNSLLLDFGAGSGNWYSRDPSRYRRQLRTLRQKARSVIGVDVDPSVQDNPALDESHVITPNASLPLATSSVDLAVADYVFEHLSDPKQVSSELTRVIRPGRWLCARTPNKFNYISLTTLAVPNRLHATILRYAQPRRNSDEIYATYFRLNTWRAIRAYFPDALWLHCSYPHVAEPSYHFNNRYLYWALKTFDQLLPKSMASNLFVFLQKR